MDAPVHHNNIQEWIVSDIMILYIGDLTFIDTERERLKRGLLFWNRAAAQGMYNSCSIL